MRYYESLFIINPELSDEETEEVKAKYIGLLENSGAVMAQVDDWGRRRLAYQVKKFNKGHYVLFEYGAEPEMVTELERNFKIDENVIRFLSVLKDLEFDPEAVANDQAKRTSRSHDESDEDEPVARVDDDDEDDETDEPDEDFDDDDDNSDESDKD